ncbi:MAG TPA: methyltransferase domain-containing protein [Ktedonobacterales bacterium]|nr:methyltransferase domain-containing protein [Ktedonobacterales bacterium]
MSDQSHARDVNARYAFDNLEARILDGLRAMGKDPDTLTPEDLAPADQLHSGGLKATLELVALAAVQPDEMALDVGGGLGGPARILASRSGCHVTVLDLNETFCRTGAALTARVGLSDRVTFQQGDAQAMPFRDQSFDVVWTQHASMNIPDKRRLYQEVFRVLRPGGRFIFHDHMAGPVQPIYFPVPWARDETINHLIAPEKARTLLREVGFHERIWEDQYDASTAWFRESLARLDAAGSAGIPIGLRLAQGGDFDEMLRVQARNFEERRVTTILGLLDRP